MQIALIKSYTDKPWRSPDTYQLIEDSLREKWPVRSIHTLNPEDLHQSLVEWQCEGEEGLFVFNIAEYLDEEHKAVFLPALLDEWRLPHLGSSAEAVAAGLDKARTKKLLVENQIPTARYFVSGSEDDNPKDQAQKISYPLIVKPVQEGGHIGIGEDSIVYDGPGLERAVQRILSDYDQPALVEEFISGEGMREFSVGILDGEDRLFTPVEIDYAAMEVGVEILSYEAAQDDLERIKLVHDPKISDEIIALAERTFDAMGASDYSRVDIRSNKTGNYVLEINVMPGLGPHSFLPEAAEEIHGLAYPQLIQRLVEHSIEKKHLS